MRLLASFLLLSPWLTAQTAAWQGLTFEHEVTPRYGYALETEYRTTYAAFDRGAALLVGSLDRQLGKYFHAAGGGRLDADLGVGSKAARLFADLYFDLPLARSPLTLESRLRYQQDRSLGGSEGRRQNALRYRAGANLEINDRLTLIGSVEFRFRFDGRDEFSRRRQTLGAVWAVSKRVEMTGFLRREELINDGPGTFRRFIVGTYASYVLPDRRERDWAYRRPFGRRIF